MRQGFLLWPKDTGCVSELGSASRPLGKNPDVDNVSDCLGDSLLSVAESQAPR